MRQAGGRRPPRRPRLSSAHGAASDPFGLDDFFQRVASREGVDLLQATFHARAVIEVVGEAVTQGQQLA
ncbi:MAG TPA: DUF2267 domain-containing protein [Actinomycetes bacterium]|nr:DUF2267 domain-containing protein [Actinomycetes bacterium]